MKKDDLITLKIEDMGINGEGIGKMDGFPFFVKDAVVGDVIEAKIMKMKKSYGYAKLKKVEEPSPFRRKPRCAYARQCGGCQLQAMDYDAQLDYKRKKIWNNLRHIGGFSNLEQPEVIGMEDPWRYRNKAQYPFGTDREGNAVAGFYAARTHNVIPCMDCCLGIEENRIILEKILEHMRRCQIPTYDEKTGKGLMRHVLIRKGFRTGELMACLVLNGRWMSGLNELAKSLREIQGMTSIMLNVNTKNTNVIMGTELLPVWGKGYITDFIGDVKYQISPLSFYQVNPAQTEKLYRIALEYAGLKGEETVWDLYCGIGTLSLFLAQRAGRVFGVEIVPEAIVDAKENAQINGIGNAEFFLGKAEEVLPWMHQKKGIHADVIVVDPPRKGCDPAALETMVRMQPERIVYVSCAPATLARDLKYLCERGYEVRKVTGVDMFPWTGHVETCVLLSRKKTGNKSTRIEIDIDLDEADRRECIGKATYQEIKDYVWEHYQAKVSHLYIAQIKKKCGLDVGENFNKAKTEGNRVPNCPPEKERMIREALKYYGMIK